MKLNPAISSRIMSEIMFINTGSANLAAVILNNCLLIYLNEEL